MWCCEHPIRAGGAWGSTEPGELRGAGEATRYRALVARLNDLTLDRPGIQCVVKAAAKRMSAPSVPD